MTRNMAFWCALLVVACIVAPYLFGVPPRRRRDWAALTGAIAFLLWLLGGFGSVRSR